MTIIIFQNSVNFTKMHTCSSMLYSLHTLPKLLSIIEPKKTSISSVERILIFLSSIIDTKLRDNRHFSKKCKFQKLHTSSSMPYTPHTLPRLRSIIERKMTSISSGETILISLSSKIDTKSHENRHLSKKCKFHKNLYQGKHAIYPSYPFKNFTN